MRTYIVTDRHGTNYGETCNKESAIKACEENECADVVWEYEVVDEAGNVEVIGIAYKKDSVAWDEIEV